MISKQTRVFTIDGINYQFDWKSFNAYVKQCAKRKNIRPLKILELVAEVTSITTEAVKQWYYGNNGPSELKMIKTIANVIEVSDCLNLMKKVKEKEKVENLTTIQIEAVKRIYDAAIEYLADFNKTDGFTGSLWYEFKMNGSDDPEEDIYQYAEEKMSVVNLVIQKEYFYLRDTEIYSEILEYAENDLYDTFDGKLSYAYRFEALADGNPTTYEDYNKALKRLNEIIEKYI